MLTRASVQKKHILRCLQALWSIH